MKKSTSTGVSDFRTSCSKEASVALTVMCEFSQRQIEQVDGPAPFDLKLTIATDPRGPHVYYGMRSETDRDGHLLEQKLAARR